MKFDTGVFRKNIQIC